ncbi:hypothetical protein D3C77_674850 [compost metagenome]
MDHQKITDTGLRQVLGGQGVFVLGENIAGLAQRPSYHGRLQRARHRNPVGV